ncbi:TRAP transporter substrate-binding protein [Aquibium microcysteis]|uniref:TRAP transporter substrate-binding protein n=1 Tax=Aquibium microcysteis TaxID=675281 RepID=UPI00165D020D|nr:TRAP transporter substrate-binding protein DctP [Aquibium microcysteis]
MNRIGFRNFISAFALGVALYSGSAAAEETWRIGTVVAPPSTLGVIVDEMAQSITTATNGAIKGERLQQPNEQEIAQNVIRGRYEMAYISSIGLAPAIPELAVLNIAYLWSSAEERDYVTDKYIVPMVQETLAKNGLTLVRYGEGGWMNLFCRIACVDPEQIKGMKVRISPTASDQMMFTRLGANHVTMTLADFFPSLQQGLVDAGSLTFGFYAVGPAASAAPHYVFTRHGHQSMFLVAHTAYWDKLTEEQRKAIEAAVLPTTEIRQRVANEDKPSAERHLKQGGFVHDLTPEQRAKWEAVVTPGHPELIAALGPRAKEIYDAVAKGKEEFKAMAK